MKLKGKLLLIAVVLCVLSSIECDKIKIRLLNRNNRLVNLNRSLKKRGVFHNHAGLVLPPQHKVYGYTPLAAPIGHGHLAVGHAAKFTLPHAHVQKFHHHVEAPSAVFPAVNEFHQDVPVPQAPEFHQHVDAPVAQAQHVPHVHPVVETHLSAPIFPPVQHAHFAPVGPTVATILPQQYHHYASVYGTSGGVIGGQPFILRPGNAVVQSYNVNYPRPVLHAHVPVAQAPVAHFPQAAHVPIAQTPVQFAHTPAVAAAPVNPGPTVLTGHNNFFVPRPFVSHAAPALPVFPSPSPATPVFPSTAVFPSARPFIPSPVVPPVFASPVPQHPFFFNQGLPDATPTVLSERPIVVPEPPQQELPSFPDLPTFPSGGSDILPGQIPSQGSDILPGQIPAQPPFQNVPQQPWTPSVFNPSPDFPPQQHPAQPQQPPVLPPVHGNLETFENELEVFNPGKGSF